jgi:hypothetical protein
MLLFLNFETPKINRHYNENGGLNYTTFTFFCSFSIHFNK